MDEIIERKVGKVKLLKSNLFLDNINDMETLEYWEDRLVKLQQPFAITYKTIGNKIVYFIYTKLRGKKSAFRVTND